MVWWCEYSGTVNTQGMKPHIIKMPSSEGISLVFLSILDVVSSQSNANILEVQWYGDLNMIKEFRFKVKSGVKFRFCTKIFTFSCEIFDEILMVKFL